MKWLKEFVLGGALVLAPSAQAAYYSFSTITAYENSRAVAAGYGTHGTDFPKNDLGGTICHRDLNSGGSPSQGAIWYHYYDGGVSGPTSNIWTSINSSTAYRCDTKINNLLLTYTLVQTRGKVCQNDSWPAPDDCATSALRNNTIP